MNMETVASRRGQTVVPAAIRAKYISLKKKMALNAFEIFC